MKLRRISSCLAVVISSTALLGAAPAEEPAGQPSTTVTPPAAKPVELPETVAIVNGEKISREELQKAFDGAVKMSGTDPSKLSDDQKLAGYRRFLDDIIIERLLKEKAADIKITDAQVDEKVAEIKKRTGDDKKFTEALEKAGLTEAELRAQIKNGLAESQWIETQVKGKGDVTDKDAEAFYKENLAQFEQPETVRASHILLAVKPDAKPEEAKKVEAAAKAAYERVKKGEDFAKVADELTEDPSGKGKGGDLGFFPKGAMVPEFDAKVSGMKIGDLSEPVKTQFGYHVIKVTDKKAAGTTPYKDVKDQLIEYLKNTKQQAAVRDVIEKLRADAKVTNNLPEPPPVSMMPPAGAGAGETAPAAPAPKSE